MIARTLTSPVTLMIVCALLLSVHLLIPLNSDNDIYQSMAFAMSEGQGLPYVGSWDHNFPGIVAYHWFGIELFGLSDVSFRLIDVINRLLIAYLTYRIARSMFGESVAWLAPMLVVLQYLASGFWNAGQRDGFAVMWLLLAIYTVIQYKRTPSKLAIITLSVVLAAFIRPTNILFTIPLAAWLLWHKQWRYLRLLALFIAGFTLACLLPWMLMPNGLEQFYLSAIRFNLDIYSPERDGASNLLASLSIYKYLFATAAAAGLTMLLRGRRASWESNTYIILLAYLVTAILLIVAMGKYHIYHFELLVPVLVLLVCGGIETVSSKYGRMLINFALFVAAFLLFYPRHLASQYVRWGADSHAREQIANNLASFENYGLDVEESVASHVRTEISPRDRVEFALLWPGLRWRAGIPSATRFTTTYAMTMSGRGGHTSYQQDWIAEYDSMLAAVYPKLIVAAMGPSYLAEARGMSPDSFIQALPRFGPMLSNNYSLDTVIGGYNIYKRED
jgi:hypothetical protein